MLLRILVFFLHCSLLLANYERGVEKNDVFWDEYLNKMYCHFSSYEIHEDRSNYNVDNLEDWGKGSKKAGLSVGPLNIEDFVKILNEKYELPLPNGMSIDQLSQHHITDINEVLEATITSDVEIIHDKNIGRIVVQGNFVKTSDFMSHSFNISEAEQIDIFALDRLFFDKFISAYFSMKNYTISVMGSEWLSKYYGAILLNEVVTRDFIGLGERIVKDNFYVDQEYKKIEEDFKCSSLVTYLKPNKGNSDGSRAEIHILGREKTDVVVSDKPGRDWDLKQGVEVPPNEICSSSSKQEVSPATEDFQHKRLSSFKRYRMFLLSKILQKNRFIKNKAYEILLRLDKDLVDDISYFEPMELIEEFKLLENHYVHISEETDIALYLYWNLHDRIGANAKVKMIKGPENHKKALIFLHTAVLGKICKIGEDTEKNLITHLKEFGDLIMEDIDEIKDAGNKVTINGIVGEYQQVLDDKIGEAEFLIGNDLQPRIEEICLEMDLEMDKLVDEITILIQDAQHDLMELHRLKLKLEGMMKWRIAFGILGKIGGALGALGPVGTLVGAGIGTFSKIGDAILDSKDTTVGYDENKYEFLEMPKKVLEDLERSEKSCSSRDKNNKRGLVDASDASKDDSDASKDDSDASKDNSDASKGDSDASKNNSDNAQKISDTVNSLTDIGIDIYERYKGDNDKIKIIEEQILKCKDQIDNMLRMRDQVCDTLKPVMGAIADNVKNLQSDLKGKSESQLLISKWNVQKTLKQVQTFVGTYYNGLDAAAKLVELVAELDEIITIMVQIFDNIEKYNQQAKLGQFIGAVQSADFTGIQIQDPELRKAVEELDLYIKCNVILLHYKRFSNAITQYSFPLADSYFKQFDIPLEMQLKKTIQETTVDAIKKITEFRKRLWEEKVTILPYDDIRHRYVRFGGDGLNDPFFVWRNETNSVEIAKLLKGEEIVLRADIRNSVHERFAIKFNEIYPRFIPADPALSHDYIDEIMQKFEVVMIHTGNSYYSCGDKSYVISTNRQLLQLSFKKKLNSYEPDCTNTVYQKIKDGDYVLSPFATWRIKLLTKDPEDWIPLRKFVDKIDIEINGIGEYLLNDVSACSHRLGRYYEEVYFGQPDEKERAALFGLVDLGGSKSCFSDVASSVTVTTKGDIIVN